MATEDSFAVQFVGKVEDVLAALTPALTALHNPLSMLFLFGPSPLRPVEVYSLSCETVPLSDGGASEAAERADQVARDMSRRVLRSLIMHTAGGPEGKAASGVHFCHCVPVLQRVQYCVLESSNQPAQAPRSCLSWCAPQSTSMRRQASCQRGRSR